VNEEEVQEETHQAHQEEEALPKQAHKPHNQLQRQPMSKPWAKILPSSKGKGRKQIPS